MLRLTWIAFLSSSFLSLLCGSWAKSTRGVTRRLVETQRNNQTSFVTSQLSFADAHEKLIDRSSRDMQCTGTFCELRDLGLLLSSTSTSSKSAGVRTAGTIAFGVNEA